jgi:hypothetical protein
MMTVTLASQVSNALNRMIVRVNSHVKEHLIYVGCIAARVTVTKST